MDPKSPPYTGQMHGRHDFLPKLPKQPRSQRLGRQLLPSLSILELGWNELTEASAKAPHPAGDGWAGGHTGCYSICLRTSCVLF